MKTNVYIEFQGKKVEEKPIINQIKENWKQEGKLVKDLESIDLYVKPEECTCYYVINQTINGKLDLQEFMQE